MDAELVEVATTPGAAGVPGSPRPRRADREQVLLQPCDLNRLASEDHAVRTIWSGVEGLDLSVFYAAIQTRGSVPGQRATDPKILIALWLYATRSGVGSGRELERLCRDHAAYRWLRGGVDLNYHTLNGFRVTHEGPS